MNRYGEMALLRATSGRPETATPQLVAACRAQGEAIEAEVVRIRDEMLGPAWADEDLVAYRARAAHALACAMEVVLAEAFPPTEEPSAESDDEALRSYHSLLEEIEQITDPTREPMGNGDKSGPTEPGPP